MANLLTLRLLRYDTNVDPVDGIDPALNIAVHDFVAGLFDLLGGYHTPAQMKSFYSMTAAEETAFDTLVAKINSASGISNKAGRVERLNSILLKWSRRSHLDLTGYDTPDDIEAQLMAIDTGF